MKNRTCPNCGYKYSYRSSLQIWMFKLIDSTWDCENCGAKLSFNVGRRTLVTIIAMFPIIFQSILIEFLQDIGLSSAVSWILLILIFLIWVIWIYTYDTFALIKKKQ